MSNTEWNDCRGSGLVAAAYDVARGRLKDLKEKLELAENHRDEERYAKDYWKSCIDNMMDSLFPGSPAESIEGELVAGGDGAASAIRSLRRQRDEFAATLEKAGEALELLYSRWEEGYPCFEDGDCGGTSMGRAVQLSSEEERQCLEAMEAAGIETVLRKKKGNTLTPAAIIARVRREAKAEVLDFIADVDDAAIAKMTGPRAAAQVLREYAAALRRGEKGPTE